MYKRQVRFKTVGQRYTPEALQMRILYAHPRIPAGESTKAGAQRKYARLRICGRPMRGLAGLRGLYYRYLYELGAMPRKPKHQGYAVRQDIRKLDRYVEQMRFLSPVSYTHLDTGWSALQCMQRFHNAENGIHSGLVSDAYKSEAESCLVVSALSGTV